MLITFAKILQQLKDDVDMLQKLSKFIET